MPNVRIDCTPLAILSTVAVLLPTAVIAQTTSSEYASEARSLMAMPAIAEAMQRIEDLDDWSLERLIELTEIPAPPFMEEVRGARYAELLEQYGADSVWTDQVGNVIGLRRGRTGERTIGFGGHLDTVFPEGTDVTVRQRGDTLFAPGIGDDTRGIVLVLTVLRALEEAGIETEDDVLFVGVVGEEGLGDLRGMKHLFADGADAPDVWIDVDGGDLSRLVTMGLGSVRYRITFTGPGGHSWGAFGLANPAHAMSRAVRYFQDVADTLTRSGPRTSYNVGRLGGGTSVNSIPFEAWMEVDMRSESPESLGRIEGVFLAAMRRGLEEENALRRDGPALTADHDKIGDRPSGEGDPSTPLVQRALATTALFGVEGYLARSSTDSNIPISLGIPAVTIGRGGEGGAGHAPDEYWINRDGHLAIQRALLLVVAEAGMARTVSAPPAAVRVTWAPEQPGQGHLFVLRVTPAADEAVSAVRGTAAGETLHFERAEGGEFESLAAVPIEAEGSITASITVVYGDGREEELSPIVPVSPGQYRHERLTVAPALGRPLDSAQQARLARDRTRAAEVSRLAHRTPRLWTDDLVLPRDARVTSGFGNGRVFNGQISSRHMGLDLDGEPGDTVMAVSRGVVALVDQFLLAGNIVYLNHGGGLLSGYFHLSEQLVAQGDTVRAGTPIGRVGATGRVTGPHLHWVVRYGSISVDPRSLPGLPGSR